MSDQEGEKVTMEEGVLYDGTILRTFQTLEESDIVRVEKKHSNLELELSSVLNRYSLENESGTPDFILAEYLLGCLKNYNEAVAKRADWRGDEVAYKPGTSSTNG